MQLSLIQRIIKLGIKSLWMHRLRSTLTTLGIVFGVCSVVAMLAIGEGASRQTQEQIAKLGSRNIIIKTVKPPSEEKAGTGTGTKMQEYGLTYDDVTRFRDTIPRVQVIVPLRRINSQAMYRRRTAAVEVVGTVPWYPDIVELQTYLGRFLNDFDMNYQQNFCVIDSAVYDHLFVADDPIGQDIKIQQDYYRVVGVVAPEWQMSAENDAFQALQSNAGGIVGTVYLPLTTVKNRFGETQIQISGTGGSAEKVELQQITIKVESTDDIVVVREMVRDLLERYHKKKDYQIVVPLELLRQAARTKHIFNIVLGSIAAISLLVGGIGIMNIMLASVSERTREIGIRRALGATRHDIIFQFLAETILLTNLGGILGLILGVAIPLVVSQITDMPTVITWWSLGLAFVISGAVGLVFGIYPAYRAADMDPVEALRHE